MYVLFNLPKEDIRAPGLRAAQKIDSQSLKNSVLFWVFLAGGVQRTKQSNLAVFAFCSLSNINDILTMRVSIFTVIPN